MRRARQRLWEGLCYREVFYIYLYLYVVFNNVVLFVLEPHRGGVETNSKQEIEGKV